MPYENEAYSKDLARGTVSVFADGGHSIAHAGSIFARSVFDEPGSLGGVISGTHLAEAEWLSHSFDVFFEGQPACRLTDKLFMNHRNTVCLAGLWQQDLAPILTHQICEAICECREARGPTLAEVQEMAGAVLDTVRGVEDMAAEKASDKNEIHRRQECFARQFIKSGSPMHGAVPADPKVLMEVSYTRSGEIMLSQSIPPRTTYPGGPTAPASIKRALNLGKSSPGSVRWDVVVLKNPADTAHWDNVHKVLEIKFKGDKWTTNQENALKDQHVRKKVNRVDESDCPCEEREEADKRATQRLMSDASEQAAHNFRKYLDWLPWPGPRVPVPAGGF